MLVNTEYFRIAAKHYEKHGRYEDGNFGTVEYERYWQQEIDRCRNGLKIGDTWVSGYHYFYLNYWRIMLVEKNESGLIQREERNSYRQKADRIESFPKFWDVDYEFFQEIERAETNGEHFVWLKPRGVGASFKGSAMCGRNYFLLKKSKSFLMADEKEYLIRDGIITKFIDGREFILRTHKIERDRYNIGFAKPSDFKASASDMQWKASTKHPETGNEVGYFSEVIGVSVKDNPEKARGKRGKLMIYEEMGKFPEVDVLWNINRRGMEEGGNVFGLMLGFGTGGSQGVNFQAFEKMFYNPKSFNIRCFDNIYDDNAHGTKCAFFTPANKIITFMDKDGNSDTKKGDEFIKRERATASESPDPNTLLQNKAELPLKPQEAVLSTAYRILPAGLAKEWRMQVEARKLWTVGVPGKLEHNGKSVVFHPNMNEHPPVTEFPYNEKKDDLTGCPVIYHTPVRDKFGRVPDNLYIIGHDPYAQDQGGESIGAVYVYMNPNNFAPPGDKIVATYFGRPKTQDEYNRIMFMLAEYYNAMIGFENDQGDVVGYAKRFKKLQWLFPEFECGWDEVVKTSNPGKRSYGMHIGFGRNNTRKLQGDKYINDWLIQPRGRLENGNDVLNLHTLNCRFTLKQIELYNIEGNFDGIAALRIVQYFKKELIYKQLEVKQQSVPNPNSLFNQPLYQ